MFTDRSKQVGMTLVEVLVASILLFIAISLAAVSYRVATKTESSAEKSVLRAVAMNFIRQSVAEELRLNPGLESGHGRWGAFEYEWQKAVAFTKNAKAGFDIESNSQAQLGKQLQLTEIIIILNNQSYEYAHLTWN